MPLDLPEADPRDLARSPLELVVCQIRYEAVQRATEGRVALGVHQRLGGKSGRFRKLEPLQNLNFTLGAQALGSATQIGWRLTSETGDWTASLQSEQASLETTAYDTWDGTYKDELFGLIDAVAAELEPATVQRVGLRYVNRVTEPPVTTPGAWEPFIAREALGLALHQHLGPGITASQQQVDFEMNDEVRATLRHGFFRELQQQQGGALTYVLDIDTYQEGFMEWNTEELKKSLNDLNDLGLRIFQQLVTNEMLGYLRGEDAG